MAFAKVDEPMIGDQLFYNAAANCLGNGDGFVEPFDPEAVSRGEIEACVNPAADHPPLTVVVLAPVSALTGESPVAHRLTMALLGAVGVGVIGWLGRVLAGDRAGWLAAGITAVYPNLFVNDGLVMSETLAALTVALALVYAYRMLHAPSLRTAIFLGALCGLAALARAELVLLVPALAVPAALVRPGRPPALRWQAAGATVAAAGLVAGPWVLFNLVRFEEPTFLSTNDGIALLGSNCEAVYFGSGVGLTDLKCLGGNLRGDQSQDSNEYRDRALDYIGEHTRRFPVVAAARIGRTWSLFRPGDMVSYNEGEGRERWVTTLGLVAFYPLLAGAVGGLVVLRRRRVAVWPLLVPVAIVTLASAATYGQTRFRVPAEPTLVVLAAVALDAAVRRLRARRRRQSNTIEASSSR